MILIADGGSTKVDWIALDSNREEVFRVKSLGLNPAVVSKNELQKRILAVSKLTKISEKISEIHFYGAGCGTPIPVKILKDILESIFVHANIVVAEDMLAAVYAASGEKPAIVCILGTGSNSCYFNGENLEMKTASLGYTIMDEASGNYFGKILLRDFYYEIMPKNIAATFKNEFNLDVDTVKFNLYRQENPNMYLAGFAKFMFEHKEEKYIRKIIKKGFKTFFKYRILPLNKSPETPIYFIGSIAFYFRDILEDVASKYTLKITAIIQRPIDNLVQYHKEKINL
ncbi:N-acetylmuramic acid/N-acetylglucosamine kinase [Polaribacter huanghezhanensis]|uniref:N-acetylglucosamine kinase n=1 Tax=Polaribacter huanghezhanensis TaxID=1354726 RepID=UPI002648F134|nr:N-acetylglucosamine kinase [Polaribacter huanghezhanensis]WKD86122.1 N-acetylmuramic acid/N-acetylglucosamine kinase [Polaribacter huanghezhanensis]